jgi:hypothetical protein
MNGPAELLAPWVGLGLNAVRFDQALAISGPFCPFMDKDRCIAFYLISIVQRQWTISLARSPFIVRPIGKRHIAFALRPGATHLQHNDISVFIPEFEDVFLRCILRHLWRVFDPFYRLQRWPFCDCPRFRDLCALFFWVNLRERAEDDDIIVVIFDLYVYDSCRLCHNVPGVRVGQEPLKGITDRVKRVNGCLSIR